MLLQEKNQRWGVVKKQRNCYHPDGDSLDQSESRIRHRVHPGRRVGTWCVVSSSYLVTCRTSWFQSLGVVSAAVDFALLVEVNEVHKKLVTRAAHKAPRMPAHTVTRPGCKNSDVASINLTTALKERQRIKTMTQLPSTYKRTAHSWTN